MRLKGTEHGFKKKLISIRRRIHRYPELGNQEFRTTEFIEKTLKGAKIPVKRFTRTGLIGLIEGARREHKRPGRTFALRADIDALPVQEKTGKPYASSRPGIMHACGHDANATMVLGAALLLNQEREAFSGSVKLI
ncbi:MAG: M20/M25/M40 family metallo-hydrolase, partial [Endomicrobiales bacterium]